MFFNSKLAPVLGSLALASLVSAVPVNTLISSTTTTPQAATASAPGSNDIQSPAAQSGGGAGRSGTTPSHFGQGPVAAPTSVPSSLGSNPFKFPLVNGFPNVTNGSDTLNTIQNQAHGSLPNGPPPPAPPAEDDLLSLRLIAFNELFEVAFFTELLANITNEVEGYELSDQLEKMTLIDNLEAVVAQEELHALNANNALNHFNAGPIQPCEYNIPVDNLQSAILLASTFTDVVLGTLGDVVTHFGQNNDSGLIRGVASVIAQEGEQNGLYRNILGKISPSAPFLSASTREIAFSALNQMFVVPGSCPNINTIDLPIFEPLTLLTQDVQAEDQNLQFSFTLNSTAGKTAPSTEGLTVVFLNQENVPIVRGLDSATINGNTVTFSAEFPFEEFRMNGLTIALVTKSTGSIANIAQAVAAAVAGPALIEID